MSANTEYKFSQGSRCKGDPQAIGQILQSIYDRDGTVQPNAVVEEARPQTSPLHSNFEWDDGQAAIKFRLEQARHLVRCVIVEREISSGEVIPTRAFVEVRHENGPYVPLEVALTVKNYHDEMLDQALSDLRAFERKYRNLIELGPVIIAIQQVLQPEVA